MSIIYYLMVWQRKKKTFTVASDHEYKETVSINIVQSFVNNSVYCRVQCPLLNNTRFLLTFPFRS